MIIHPPPELLGFADAEERLGGSAGFEGDYDTVLLLDGDVVVEGDFLEAVAGIGGKDAGVIVITGDLTVDGPIALYETTPGLCVRGTTRAETLEGGDAEIYLDDGVFTHLIYGYYNHGILETGVVETPWVINSDHDLRVTAPGARFIDNFNSRAHLLADDADFASDEIAERFVPEVVVPDGDAIDVGAFLDRLRAGLPVLNPPG